MERIIELNKQVDVLTNNYTNFYSEGHPHLEKSWNKSINEVFADVYVDQFGIVRWKSNDNVPFEDMLADFTNNGLIDETIFTISVMHKESEDISVIEEYREWREANPYTEMRAAYYR